MSAWVITGPTGSGKSTFAESLGVKIFNADPFQFYREIPILSNQPEEKINYQFVADRSLAESTNAGAFSREALPYLSEKGVWVGMGLYLGAVLFGLDEERKKGTPFQGEPRTTYRMIVLNPDRQVLYEFLDRRVDQMLARGAKVEAQKIFEMIQAGTVSPENPVLRAIGLSHLLKIFSGELTEIEGLRLWKRDTRRLAKRQITWLRKFCSESQNRVWVDPRKLTSPFEILHSTT